jgi:hypothetical protein
MAARGGLWLIYALGGGWGHLTRAAALALAALPRHRIRILTNSPYAARVRRALPQLDLAILDPSSPLNTARHESIRQVEAANPECLIVDTFPRGLGGELAELLASLPATTVLVHRYLNPEYVAESGLHAFVGSNFHLVLIPGEGEGAAFDDLPATAITEPWLVRDPQPRARTGATPRIVVCASGNQDELAWYGQAVSSLGTLHPGLDICCVAPLCPPGCPQDCWVEHWPASDLYSAADAVIGGAGYNVIHECAACEVPLIARPWPRKYDRQWIRASRAVNNGWASIVETPMEAAQAAIDQLRQPKRDRVRIRNGATDAVALIERKISSPPATSPVR